jgi:hypothetical protein
MKKIIIVAPFIVLLSCASITTFAQETENAKPSHIVPSWISEKGYWVIESNINNPLFNILYFYNNNNILVYKEVVPGIVINLKKRSIKMRLKKVVEDAVTAYEQKHQSTENEMWVINLINKKQF